MTNLAPGHIFRPPMSALWSPPPVITSYVPDGVAFTADTWLSRAALSGVTDGANGTIYLEMGYPAGAVDDDTPVHFSNNDGSEWNAPAFEETNQLSTYVEDQGGTVGYYDTSGVDAAGTRCAFFMHYTAAAFNLIRNNTTINTQATGGGEVWPFGAQQWNIMSAEDGFASMAGTLYRCAFWPAALDVVGAGASAVANRNAFHNASFVGRHPFISWARFGVPAFDIWERTAGDIVGGDGDQTGNNAFDYMDIS